MWMLYSVILKQRTALLDQLTSASFWDNSVYPPWRQITLLKYMTVCCCYDFHVFDITETPVDVLRFTGCSGIVVEKFYSSWSVHWPQEDLSSIMVPLCWQSHLRCDHWKLDRIQKSAVMQCGGTCTWEATWETDCHEAGCPRICHQTYGWISHTGYCLSLLVKCVLFLSTCGVVNCDINKD